MSYCVVSYFVVVLSLLHRCSIVVLSVLYRCFIVVLSVFYRCFIGVIASEKHRNTPIKHSYNIGDCMSPEAPRGPQMPPEAPRGPHRDVAFRYGVLRSPADTSALIYSRWSASFVVLLAGLPAFTEPS